MTFNYVTRIDQRAELTQKNVKKDKSLLVVSVGVLNLLLFLQDDLVDANFGKAKGGRFFSPTILGLHFFDTFDSRQDVARTRNTFFDL